MDPISLEPLSDLDYPPFQLCSTDPTSAPADATIHYFDGAVLAYFLVSQMNFIDPLNRRPLLAMELKSLDNYLKTFNLGQANVVEAYKSNKANEEAGGGDHHHQTRAEYLQHEARNLLEALFDHRKDKKDKKPDPTANFRSNFERDRGYNQQAGLSLIDDDVNPGMRGGFVGLGGLGVCEGGFGSAVQVPGRPNAIDTFPTLQSVTPMTPLPDLPGELPLAPPGAGGMSLSAISGMVKPTVAVELDRMKAARDLSLQKAAMNRMGVLGIFGGGAAPAA
ncbi:hypothetical protein TrRE_jg142, partial [Triparma retinervis]